MQQALVGAAVLAVLGLKASYPLVRVYWLENPEKTFAEIRDILQEIEDDLSRLEKQVITRILELSGTAGKGLGYRGVKELKREWHDCNRVYLRLKHEMRKNYPQPYQLAFSGRQLMADIRSLRGRVHDLEQDWLRTSSIVLYDTDPDDSDVE